VAARGSRATLVWWIGIATTATVALLAQARHWFPFTTEHALVALRFADRLGRGRGWTWTDGDRTEGYASLLWVASTGALRGIGVEVAMAALVLGIGFTLVAVMALLRCYRAAAPSGLVPGGLAALAIATSGPIAAWSIGGLEATLVAALLAWAVVLLRSRLSGETNARGVIPAGIVLALLSLARPEGVVLGLLLGLAWGSVHRNLRLTAALVGWPVAALAAQTLFRILQHGDAIPWLVRVRWGSEAFSVARGLVYVVDSLPTFAPLIVMIVVALTWASRRTVDEGAVQDLPPAGSMRLLVLPLIGWLAFVIVIGGDDLPARRFMIPAVVLLAFLAAESLVRMEARGIAPALRVALAAFTLALYVPIQLLDPVVRRVQNDRATIAQGRAVGHMLGRAFGGLRPKIAVDQPGAIPFASRLPALDMSGVTDRRRFALNAEDSSSATAGYVLDVAPDLVVFCSPAGGDTVCYQVGRALRADPRFAERYRIINFQTPDTLRVHSRIWVRRDAGPLAIERGANRIVIPGWHIDADLASTVRLDEFGQAGVTVRPNRVTGVTGLELGPGRWIISLDANRQGVTVWVRDAATGLVLAQRPDQVGIEYSGGTIDIALQSGIDVPVIVRRLVIERVG
jgi:hypothetical protein